MKKQNILLLLLLGWLAGLACCSIFTGRSDTTAAPAAQSNTRIISRQVKQAEENNRRRITAIQQQSEVLQTLLQQTASALQLLKQQHQSTEAFLQSSISKQQRHKADKDTMQLLRECDTLAAGSLAYLQSAKEKDSLQENIEQNLLAQLQNKDSIIRLQQQQYSYLQKEFDHSLLLAGQQQKTIRRQQTGNRLKHIGLILLAGLVLSRH